MALALSLLSLVLLNSLWTAHSLTFFLPLLLSVYGIIELRGLMAAASLIWLSPLPHATCHMPQPDSGSFGKRQSFVQSFLCCSYCTHVAATCCCWSVAAVFVVAAVAAASVVLVPMFLLLL